MELIVVAALVAVALYLYRNRSGAREPERQQPEPSPPSRNSLSLRVTIGASSGGSGTLVSASECWVPPGRDTTVARRHIPGGMLYVGSGLISLSGYRTEPALIDPALPIDGTNPDRDGSCFSYWPSYETIPAGSRAAYLDWLATGRSAPGTAIGYVFLFFYGLERRLLVDARDSAEARDEAPMIVAEVRRLLALYGSSSGSFRNYATGFLGVATAMFGATDLDASTDLVGTSSVDVPAPVRVALARLARSRTPVPADLAFALYATHPGTRSATPLRRCADEIRTLFVGRYRHRLGEGLVVPPARTQLELTYTPASSGFAGTMTHTVADLYEADVLARVPAEIREVGDGCVADLEAYSRFLGRRREEQASLKGLALLPAELLATASSSALDALRSWLDRCAGSGIPAVVSGADLLALWPGAEDRLPKAEAVALSQLLEKLGYGLEPDVRFGGPALNRGKPMVIYRLPPTGLVAPTAAYAAGSVLLNLSVAVACADGGLNEVEQTHLEEHLERGLGLDEAEVPRLRAHLRWLVAVSPGLAGVKKRLEATSDAMRGKIAAFLVSVAGADGRLDASEVRTLQRIYRLLGRDEDEVFATLHDLEAQRIADDDGPVVVRAAGVEEVGVAIPPPPAKASSTIRLDMERVKVKLAETATVSALLADVFTDDVDAERHEQPIAPWSTSPDVDKVEGVIAGLDERHSKLLRQVNADKSLSREKFEDLASGLGLLPDGALDVLNERAIELFGEPVLEGDEDLTINYAALEAMFA